MKRFSKLEKILATSALIGALSTLIFPEELDDYSLIPLGVTTLSAGMFYIIGLCKGRYLGHYSYDKEEIGKE